MTRSRDEILAAVESYYSGRLSEHGRTARGVDWNSSESQLLRFSQLVRCLAPDGRFSINDFGCGYGELAHYLARSGYAATYVGFDVSVSMVAAAEEHTAGLRDCSFTNDVAELPVADYTVASGLFNVKLDLSVETWEEYIWDTVTVFHAHSSRAFAFNLLTAHSDPDRVRSDLYYADPGATLDRCVRTLSRHTAVVHDYGLYEFTTVVRREALQAAEPRG